MYVAPDLFAADLYPGYSFTDQAVSELFATAAPTSYIVVPLFSLASILLLCFALDIELSAHGDRAIRLVALMFAASAIDDLMLWNFFPMHMRGERRTFTDAMHLILGANVFVWFAIGLAAWAFRNWFRSFSIAALVLLLLPALSAFQFAEALDAGQATPGLGLVERMSQYGYQTWQIVLAVLFIMREKSRVT